MGCQRWQSFNFCIYIQPAAAVNAAAADAVGMMELKVVSEFIPAGDHEVVICDVVSWKHMQQQEAGGDAAAADSTPLYTGYLRENGFL
jgi:hypothetical protein